MLKQLFYINNTLVFETRVSSLATAAISRVLSALPHVQQHEWSSI